MKRSEMGRRNQKERDRTSSDDLADSVTDTPFSFFWNGDVKMKDDDDDDQYHYHHTTSVESRPTNAILFVCL